MKYRPRPIDVVLAGGCPASVRLGARSMRVARVLDSWTVQGRWWACEERRTYYRLETQQCVVEVYEAGGRWYLSKILD